MPLKNILMAIVVKGRLLRNIAYKHYTNLFSKTKTKVKTLQQKS